MFCEDVDQHLIWGWKYDSGVEGFFPRMKESFKGFLGYILIIIIVCMVISLAK